MDGATPPMHYVDSVLRRVGGGGASGGRRLSLGGARAGQVRRLGAGALPEGHSIRLLSHGGDGGDGVELLATASRVRVDSSYMRARRAPRGDGAAVDESTAATVLKGIACVDKAGDKAGETPAAGVEADAGAGSGAGAECVVGLMRAAKESDDVVAALLVHLAPAAFTSLARASPRGPGLVLSVAAAVGSPAAQAALVDLLAARTATGFEPGAYAGAVDPT